MPKKRIKASGNILKSGILNSSIKKHAALKESQAGKYFKTSTTPVNTEKFISDDFFNDRDTYIFDKNREVDSVLNVNLVPLESNSQNFYITSDPHFISEGIVSVENESKINKNFLTYNNIMQEPNVFDFNSYKSSNVDSASIFSELRQNYVEKIHTPFVEFDIENEFNSDFLNETITDYENYYLGNETRIEIEIDFGNSSDLHLTNTQMYTKNIENTGADINLINDSGSFSTQYNFDNAGYTVSSQLLTNAYWNNNLSRWEYNLDEEKLQINSFVANENLIFPNSITHNYNGTVDNTNTIKYLYEFVDKYISTTPISNSSYYERFNHLHAVLGTSPYALNTLTSSYGFPDKDIWQPSKDHLIKMEDYIARDFLLEKVVFEGNISAVSEFPTKNGNFNISQNIENYNLENFPIKNKSKYNIVGANFYLLKTNKSKNKNKDRYKNKIAGFRTKLLDDTQTISEYSNSDVSFYIDENFSDLENLNVLNSLSGEVKQNLDDLVVVNDNGEQSIVIDEIKNSIVTEIRTNNETSEITGLKSSGFYYLDELNDDLTSPYDNLSKNYFLVSSSREEFINYNIYNSSAQTRKVSKEFVAAGSEKLDAEVSLLATSDLFFIKKESTVDRFDSHHFENKSIESVDDDLSINIESKNFKVYSKLKSNSSDQYTNESIFGCSSALGGQQEVVPQVNEIKSVRLKKSTLISLFTVISEVNLIRNEGEGAFLQDSESNFNEYVPGSITPDYVMFQSRLDDTIYHSSINDPQFWLSNGINFRIVYNESVNGEYTLDDIFSYDTNNDINKINIACLKNNNAVKFFINRVRNDIQLNSQYSTHLAYRDINFLFAEGEVEGEIFNSISEYSKADLFISIIMTSIFLSKVNDYGEKNSIVSSVVKTVDEINNVILNIEFADDTFVDTNSLTNAYSSKSFSIEINPGEILFNSYFSDVYFNSRQNARVQSFVAETNITGDRFNDEIIIFEGKFKDSDNYTNLKVKEQHKEFVSRSGKTLGKRLLNKEKTQILSPKDSIVFGINSFSNFNTLSSHISFHDKIKVTLFGREVKKLSKNESFESTNIKKTFVGNNTQDTFEKSNSFVILSNESKEKRLLCDSIYPGAAEVSYDILNKQIVDYNLDAEDVYQQQKQNKIIIIDKKYNDINDDKYNDVIKDWHEHYYLSKEKSLIENKNFKSSKNYADNITLYYDSFSFALNNDYYYNALEKINESLGLQKSLINRKDYFTVKDIFLPIERNEVIYDADADNFKLIDYSLLGLREQKRNNIRLLSETNLFNREEENFIITSKDGDILSSLQFINVPYEFYILENQTYLSNRKISLNEQAKIFKDIASWVLVLEATEIVGFDVMSNYLTSIKNNNTQWDIKKSDASRDRTIFCKKNDRIILKHNNTIIEKSFYFILDSEEDKYFIVVPFKHDEIVGEYIKRGRIDDIPYTFERKTYVNSSGSDIIDVNLIDNEDISIPDFSFANIYNLENLNINDFITTELDDDTVPILEDNFPLSYSELSSNNLNSYKDLDVIYAQLLQYKLSNPKIPNKNNIIYDEFLFQKNAIKTSKVIKDNNLTLINKIFLEDQDYNRKLTSAYSLQGFDKNIKDNIIYYVFRVHKKKGLAFVKTNIEFIFSIKENETVFEIQNLNLVGVKYNNRVFDKDSLLRNQNLFGLKEDDIIRCYLDLDSSLLSDINKSYFEIDLSMKLEGSSIPVIQKSNFSTQDTQEGELVTFGVPVANISNSSEDLYGKLFLYGYRKSRDYKYPVDKFDGFRYGVQNPTSVKLFSKINRYSYGQFKDLSYDTQSYSHTVYNNNVASTYFCIEKAYYDDYFIKMSESEITNRDVFLGSNSDIHARSYYPFIETNDDLSSLYS